MELKLEKNCIVKDSVLGRYLFLYNDVRKIDTFGDPIFLIHKSTILLYIQMHFCNYEL